MKTLLATLFFVAGIGTAIAQVPAGAPAGMTGMCKDGSYSEAASKRGACAGHKGVKDWYAAETPVGSKPGTPASTPAAVPAAPAVAATPAPPSAPAAAMPSKAAASTSAPAVGGGAGKVWVNTASKVYHCEGTKYYGKTKAGSYMTEQEAIAAGAHADHKKACKA